jgi:aminoacrylate hydrolase
LRRPVACRRKLSTLASSFARPDAFLRAEFALRRKLAAEADAQTLYGCYALFLFSPRFTRAEPQAVRAWIDRCAAAPLERDVSLARMDMIMAQDTVERLSEIRKPTLVLLEGGHLIHDERPDAFFSAVRNFIEIT